MADSDWIELSLIIPDPDDGKREVAVAILADIGFESFANNEAGIAAYIQGMKFSSEMVTATGILDLPMFQGGSLSYRTIEKINWNLEWEKNFEPVIIANRCYVRAPFHPKPEGVDFDIVIEPKMSFGTGHHQTTALMTELLLNSDVTDLQVLDMGCGTGILAILASQKGAAGVNAVDIDEWACINTLENASLNNCEIVVRKGDIASVEGEKYDLILANITRNILLENMTTLNSCLNQGGTLFLSGFYSKDLPEITKATASSGLTFITRIIKDDWCAASFRK